MISESVRQRYKAGWGGGGGQTVKRRGISHKPEIKERSPIYIVSPWHIVTVNTTMIPWQAHECKNNLQNLFLISAKFVVFLTL
jgi:hypothetical protein